MQLQAVAAGSNSTREHRGTWISARDGQQIGVLAKPLENHALRRVCGIRADGKVRCRLAADWELRLESLRTSRRQDVSRGQQWQAVEIGWMRVAVHASVAD